jgi:hypothetical protein
MSLAGPAHLEIFVHAVHDPHVTCLCSCSCRPRPPPTPPERTVAAEYGLSASVGPLSVATLASGGDDYSLLKDSGSPMARWVAAC